MESHNRYEGLHAYAVGTVRHHAWRLAHSPGFLPEELEDLEQEMMLHIHRQLPLHNPAKASLETFISRLIDNFTITLHRQTMVGGIGDIQLVSLNEPVLNENGDTGERLTDISADNSLWPHHEAAWHEGVENRLDAARILKRLPPSIRRLALLYMMDSVSSASRSGGVARQTVYEAISRIRRMLSTGKTKKDSDTSPPRCVCKGYGARKDATRRVSAWAA
ncbi:MAG: sigma-70 family RNA polymerase sigma factor [Magnetococcales bacterium]|nr:sigma-70 family RNA polymerase sigma factor [Magnetococcales bacterium]